MLNETWFQTWSESDDMPAFSIDAHNAHALDLADRIEVRQGDLFAPARTQSFDSIIFNMPLLHLEHDGKRHPALDDDSGTLAGRFFARFADRLAPEGGSPSLRSVAVRVRTAQRSASSLLINCWR